ncbi:MAG: response regulator [Elusimicrobia bacterium]|nr:response regulator [Elusimicrobiota bacterium]
MRKILVVDDNPAFTDLVEMVFGGEYEVFKAFDGQQGIELAGRAKPDIILLDVMMPKVSGVEMLRMLQAEQETRAIPVIILTASQFDATTEALFKQEPNVSSFLQKPCGIESLRAQIRTALAKGVSG